MFCS